MNEPAADLRPTSRRPTRWMRVTLWIATNTITTLAVLIVGTWLQARVVKENLALARPIAVTVLPHDAVAMRALDTRVTQQAKANRGRVWIDSADASRILQAMLSDGATVRALRGERQRLVRALAERPDPLGLWGDNTHVHRHQAASAKTLSHLPGPCANQPRIDQTQSVGTACLLSPTVGFANAMLYRIGQTPGTRSRTPPWPGKC